MIDEIVEPARSKLIPHFKLIKKISETQNALGCSIAGAGPASFVLVQSKKEALSLQRKLELALKGKRGQYKVWLSRLAANGARVI